MVYDRPLKARNLFLLEDCQLSRWQEFRAWNCRDNTLPVVLRGTSGVRNVIASGEADDSLCGGDQGDIPRGRGGANVLEGLGGPDRFQIAKSGGGDVILDFSPEDGDVVDLTELFAVRSGSPADVVHIKAELSRGAAGEYESISRGRWSLAVDVYSVTDGSHIAVRCSEAAQAQLRAQAEE